MIKTAIQIGLNQKTEIGYVKDVITDLKIEKIEKNNFLAWST
jgi:hypothetical protein